MTAKTSFAVFQMLVFGVWWGARFDPIQLLVNETLSLQMKREIPKQLVVLAGIGACVSLVLVVIGILVLAGMQSPTQGMTYGFTPEMLSNPVFVEHHVKAFGWLFAAGYLSGLIMMWFDHRRSVHSD